MRKLAKIYERLSKFDFITAIDPIAGGYKDFRIVGTYLYIDGTQGLKLAYENGAVFNASSIVFKEGSERMEVENESE